MTDNYRIQPLPEERCGTCKNRDRLEHGRWLCDIGRPVDPDRGICDKYKKEAKP